MKIEPVTFLDLFYIADLATTGVLNQYHNFDKSDPRGWVDMWNQHRHQQTGGMLAAKKGEQVCGAIAWTYAGDLYDETVKVAQEESWWVLPELASTRLPTKLLEAFLLQMETEGCEVEMTLDTNASPRSIWMLERYGFRMDSIVLRKGLTHGKEGEKSREESI